MTTETTATPIKEKSTTDLYKEHLQATITEVTGNKVSKEVAWKLFKAIQNAPFEFMLNSWTEAGKPTFVKETKMTQPTDGSEPKQVESWSKIQELILSLAGVGRYEILPAGARGSKAEAGLAFVPRPRYYPSQSVVDEVEVAFGLKEAKEKVDRKPPVRTKKADAPVADAAPQASAGKVQEETVDVDEFDIDIEEI